MPRPSDIESIIEKAVGEVLERALPDLRARISARAAEQLQALLSSGPSSDQLEQATAALQEASAQGEILRQLLEGGIRFAGRLALFVVKGGAITGWQAVGFHDNDSVKSASLHETGAVADAIESRAPVEGRASEFDHSFLSAAGLPSQDRCLVLPLIVKDKVAALIYADAGSSENGAFDPSALKVLTRSAGLWLEVLALRKTAPPEEPQPAAAAAAFASPNASPAPAKTSITSTISTASEESDLHRKARRFAKLLVEEIKLYNQAKVAEGRKQGDLYQRLREDIEKSRATYDKRYGESLAASANYFDQELIRILADNDSALMGAGFPR
ncbi:MAG TPA: hypothetical protein VFL42_08585 [Terriglobales bacterium]|nr:hypothetical protein [Terriglobales bacterium]